VNDYGVITNVPFAKLPNTPTAPVNTAGIPSPGAPGMGGANPLGQRSIPGLPSRTVRTLGGTGNQGNPGGSTTGAGLSPGLTGMSGSTPQANRGDAPAISGDAEIIMLEAQREHLKSKGDPTAGLLPPTELTSPEDLRTLVTPGSRVGRQSAPQLPQ